MTADIIATLPLPQRRVGTRCLTLGKQHLQGKPTAAPNRAYPHVLRYLQELIALSLPQFDSTQ
eukprot:1863815-Amphidinium_carterae.1